MAETKIEWTKWPDRTGVSWNPIRARDPGAEKVGWHCVKVSRGCKNCYAETQNLNKRGLKFGTGLPYTANSPAEVFLDEKVLMQPYHWRKPRAVFVCSMTDLFGEFVSEQAVYEVFEVFYECPQHLFLVLTKRPQRMLREEIGDNCISNVLLGTSVEDQRQADERREYLQAIAALGWNTWVSYEPALGDVDWIPWLGWLKWMVVGGESGSKAGPCSLRWIRQVRDQCREAGVPIFLKQLGTHPYWGHDGARGAKGMLKLTHPKGGDPREWPDFLQDWREFPKVEQGK